MNELRLHPVCQKCGWRQGSQDSWDGLRCRCGKWAPSIDMTDPQTSDLFIPAPGSWRRRPVIRYERDLLCFNVEGEVDNFFIMDDFGDAVPAYAAFGLCDCWGGFFHHPV